MSDIEIDFGGDPLTGKSRGCGCVPVVALALFVIVYILKHLVSFEVAAVLAICIVCVALVLRYAFDKRSPKSAPVGTLPVGLAQIKPGMHVDTLGRVRPTQTFNGPISHRDCVWYRVRIFSVGSDAKLLHSGEATERFELTDGADLIVVVHTEHALFAVHKTELRSPAIMHVPELVSFVTSRNLPIDLTQDLLVVEDHIEVSETVFVRGLAKLEEQASVPSGAMYRGADVASRIELVAAPKHPVAIGLAPIPKDEADLEINPA